jgi:hypothetical protein
MQSIRTIGDSNFRERTMATFNIESFQLAIRHRVPPSALACKVFAPFEENPSAPSVAIPC